LIDVADTTASWSSGAVFQYITSFTQNAAVKPGTVFISRPLFSATEDGSKAALFTNGTALTVTNDSESVATSGDDLLQVRVLFPSLSLSSDTIGWRKVLELEEIPGILLFRIPGPGKSWKKA